MKKLNSRTSDPWLVQRELATVDLGWLEPHRVDCELVALDNASGDVEQAKDMLVSLRDNREYAIEVLGMIHT